MTSLTVASITTRKIIRFSIYGFIAIVIMRAIVLTGIKIYRLYNPEPPEPPTVAFGKLPKLPFPQKDGAPNLTYKLETATGSLPELPYLAKVYFMPKVFSQLLSLDKAKEKAAYLGYSTEGYEVTDTIYKFQHKKVPAELQINIATGVFSISYDLEKDPTPLETRPALPEVAQKKARDFLEKADMMPKDLEGPVAYENIKLENNKLVGAISLSDANFVKVHLFRKAYDELPSLTSKPDESNVWIITSGQGAQEKQVVAVQYHYFPIDETKFETYPIKTAEAAWQELSEGKGYIARMPAGGTTDVTVRNIYLAYYDSGEQMEFYQPIIVFEGDRDFRAYLPAVTGDYYGL